MKKGLGMLSRSLPWVRRSMKKGLTVFIFHEVSDEPSLFCREYGLAVSCETFERQVSWIQETFTLIHPADVLNGSPLPEHAAMISFDDGFLGAFENALPLLEKRGIPSVVFLNMRAVLEKEPILSATACFLDKYVPEFQSFSEANGLAPPFHLTLTPSVLKAFEDRHGPLDREAVLGYQGRFADEQTVRRWNHENTVVYGNHLFDHWNAPALSPDEFEDQYRRNEHALSPLGNRINLFSFTNGKPGACYSNREIEQLKLMGAGRLFSGSGTINHDVREYVLSRISLSEGDRDSDHLWFRMGQAALRSVRDERCVASID